MISRKVRAYEIGRPPDKMFKVVITEHFYMNGECGYVADISSIGISCFGATEDQVISDVKIAMLTWLETATEEDIDNALSKRLNNRRNTSEDSSVTASGWGPNLTD